MVGCLGSNQPCRLYSHAPRPTPISWCPNPSPAALSLTLPLPALSSPPPCPASPQVMSAFGYEFLQALVTDIDPANKVKDAMNEINAAKRLR